MLKSHNTHVSEPSTIVADELSQPSLEVTPADAYSPQDRSAVFTERTWPVIREIIETLLLAVVIWVLVNAVTARYVVEGPSMEDTLFRGYRLIVNRLAYRFGAEPQRGDVIVFYSPQTDEILVKRVIGLPGERLRLGPNGQVFINDQLIQEPYTSSVAFTSSDGQWDIPEGHLFVMGDNRARSSDSRRWGMVSENDIIGRALIIYWPVGEVKALAHFRGYGLESATP